MEHVQGSEHLSKASNEDEREKLLAYHAHFSNLHPTYQAQLIYFEPNTLEETKCWLCQTVVHYCDIVTHILDQSHKDAVTVNFQEDNTSVFNAIRVICYDIVNVNKLNEIRACEAISRVIDNVFPLDGAVRYYLRIEPKNKAVDEEKYDKLLLENVYPECITAACYEINQLPYSAIQIKSNTEAFCLLCNCHIEADYEKIICHLNHPRHKQNSVCTAYISALETYHRTFMLLPFDLQTHVLYFTLCSAIKLRCKLCNQRVNYKLLKHHLLSDPHRSTILTFLATGLFFDYPLGQCSAIVYFKLAKKNIDENPLFRVNYISNIIRKEKRKTAAINSGKSFACIVLIY